MKTYLDEVQKVQLNYIKYIAEMKNINIFYRRVISPHFHRGTLRSEFRRGTEIEHES